jgi:hypothetical protein
VVANVHRGRPVVAAEQLEPYRLTTGAVEQPDPVAEQR